MKKVKIFIYILICIFSLNVMNVNAESCETLTGIYTTPSGFDKKGNVYLLNTNLPAGYYRYELYTLFSGNSSYVAYCRNAGVAETYDNTHNSSNQSMKCVDTVFDTTVEINSDYDKAKLAYDKGIVYLLENGYKINGSDIDYISTSIALRAYEMLWNFNTNNIKDTKRLNKIMEYYANWLIDDIDIINKLKTIDSKVQQKHTVQTKYTDAYYKSEFGYSSTTTELTSKVEEKVKNNVKKALDAAIDYLTNGAASIKVTEFQSSSKIKNKDNIINYKVTQTYEINVNKFDSNESTANMSFKCFNCNSYKINYKLYIHNGRKYEEVSKINNENLLNKSGVVNGTGIVKVKIVFEGNSNYYSGETINYNLDFQYKDDTVSTEAYVMQHNNSNCDLSSDDISNNCQKFYMLYKEDTIRTISVDSNFDFKIDTTESCTAYIKNADCNSKEDNDIYVFEGYEIDRTTCNYNNIDENNENIEKCVINGKDASGESYQAKKLVDNDYCSVFCKEDYHFTLPGIKEANSGKYFSLKATVKGTKSCYMAKKVDYNTFIDIELEDARKEIIKAYNEWNKWNTAYESDPIFNEGRYSCSQCPGCTGDGWYIDTKYFKYDINGNGSGKWEPVSYTEDGGKKSCKIKTCDWNGPVDVNGDKTCGTQSCSGTSECTSGSSSKLKENLYDEHLETATTKLNAAIKKYRNLINAYNMCSGLTVTKYNNNNLQKTIQTGWKMDYDYDPDILFWYEESYMKYANKKELETVGNITPSEIKETFWNSYINKNNNVATEEYDSSKYFLCYSTNSGFECNKVTIEIGKAKYVKQEMTVEVKYVTPTQFYTIYPTGAIVVADKNNENNIENSSELTNLLPVGLGTTQGVYNYVLRVKNLGEYYDDPGKFGRLWGSDDSVVVTVMEEAENGENCSENGALTSSTVINNKLFKDGAYVCSYKVNCSENNCPVVCDPTCKNPDCPENDCPVECENCVYTNNSTNIGYKPITPGDINPNDRELGVNWKYDENSISTGLELKAYATTKEIEEAGEKIYDINYEDNDSSEEFSMQVKLTASTINFIKNYNEQNASKGGYANNTLKCYDYTQNESGKDIVYDNIYCYSTFLDALIEETGGPIESKNYGSDNVKIVGGTRYFDEIDRKNKTSISGYWTTWSEATGHGWTITTTHGIDYYKKNYKEIGIGPSWK